MGTQIYRAVVIGHTGQGDYGHGLDVVFNGLPRFKVVGVADPDPAGRAQAVARTGAAEGFADYREMLRRTRPQIASIAPRWIGSHRDMLLACVDAGVKGIYCEKPFARTLEEADEILAACRKANVVIAVAHQNRAIPYLDQIARLVREGAIGTPRRIRGKGKDDRRGGAEDLIVLGTHVLDMMRAVAGNPQWAWAHVRAGDRELAKADVIEGAEQVGPIGGDNLSGYYAFSNGVAGSYESYAGKGATRQMGLWIEGTEGTITIHGSMDKQVYICRQPQWTPELGASAWERLRMPRWDNGPDGHPRSGAELLNLANQRMVEAIVNVLENGGEHFSSGEDARWAMEMYLALPESQRTGRRVALPMKERRNSWSLF